MRSSGSKAESPRLDSPQFSEGPIILLFPRDVYNNLIDCISIDNDILT